MVRGHLHLSAAREQRAALCSDIVREALSNIARHAHANHVTLEFHEVPEGTYISIEDDGAGLKSGGGSGSSGLGLLRLEERLKAIAGPCFG